MVRVKYIRFLRSCFFFLMLMLLVYMMYMAVVLSDAELPDARPPDAGSSDKSVSVPAPETRHRIYTVSNLSGRLGNHLHNLVGTYGLARTNNRTLVLQPSFYKVITHFINASYLHFEVGLAPSWVQNKTLRYATYEAEMERLPQQDFVLGRYVQSVQYFLPYADDIRRFLVINDDLVKSAQSFLRSLRAPETSVFVGVHVRRGDLLTESETNLGRIVPKQKYLKNAMTHFLSKYQNVQFIVVSDDIDWCKNKAIYFQPGRVSSLRDYGVHFSSAAGSSTRDLALLAQCNHTIITVGTFGWWGAWLAGGDTVYFNRPLRQGSPLTQHFTADDYFWPSWTGMGDN